MFLDKIALTLSIIGGLNWGMIGLFNFDLGRSTAVKPPEFFYPGHHSPPPTYTGDERREVLCRILKEF